MPPIMHSLNENMMFYFFLYALFCLVSSTLFALLLRNKYPGHTIFLSMFFTLFSFFIPVVGWIVSANLFINWFIKPKLKPREIIAHPLNIPAYQHAPIQQRSSFGEAVGGHMLSSKEDKRGVRKNMLVAVNQFYSAKVNTLNRKLLRDQVDEIRLYAQTFIDRQERSLFNLLSKIELNIQKKKGIDKARAQKMMAEVLWERVYLALVDEKGIPEVLDKINIFGSEAMSVLHDDNVLPALLFRVSLKQRRFSDAEGWLDVAQKNGLPMYRWLSYRAELAFIEKNYFYVANLMCKLRKIDMISLGSLKAFWSKS